MEVRDRKKGFVARECLVDGNGNVMANYICLMMIECYVITWATFSIIVTAGDGQFQKWPISVSTEQS